MFNEKLLSNTLLNKCWRYIPFCVMSLFSCQANDKKTDPFVAELVKIDSFVVRRDTRFNILDHHSDSGNYLGYDPITKNFLVIDRIGNIVQEVKRIGEGPNEYNSNLSTAAFNEVGGGMFVQSSNELIWYDKNWNIKKRWKYAPSFGVTVYGGPRFKTSYYFKKDKENPLVFTSFFPGIKIPISEIQSISKYKGIIEIYESSKDTLMWKLPIDFKRFNPLAPNEKEFDLTQIYFLDNKNGLLFLSFDNSLTVGIYDLDDELNFNSEITLDEKVFMDKGRGKMVKLFPVFKNNLLLLRYSGISEAELIRKKDENKTYLPVNDTNLYRFYLVSRDKGALKGLPFPDNVEPTSEIIPLGSDKFLMKEKEEDNIETSESHYSVYAIRMNVQ